MKTEFCFIHPRKPLLGILLYVLVCGSVNAQSSGYGTINVNGTMLGSGTISVNAFTKAEIDIPLYGAPQINGYHVGGYFADPLYIDMTVTFVSPSGVPYTVDAFYYRDYEISCADCPENTFCYDCSQPQEPTNSMEPTSDNSWWKARFVPMESGVWTFSINTVFDKDNNWSSYSSISYTHPEVIPQFTCIQQDGKGYIRKHINNKNLQFENGDPLYLIGENIEFIDGNPTLTSGYRQPNGTIQSVQVSSTGAGHCIYVKLLNELTSKGGNYFRFGINTAPDQLTFYKTMTVPATEVFIVKDYSHPANVDDPNTTYTSPYVDYLMYNMWHAYTYDKVIETAMEKNVYMKISLLKPLENTTGFNGKLNPFIDLDEGENNPCDFYNPSSPLYNKGLRRYQNYCRYVIARWGYATNIVAWEMVDEWDHNKDGNNNLCVDQTYYSNHMINWMLNNANFIKSKDLNRHLVDAGTRGVPHPDEITLNQDHMEIIGNPVIDLSGTHNYHRIYAAASDYDNNSGYYSSLSEWICYGIDFETYSFATARHLQKNYFKKPYILNSYWNDSVNVNSTDFTRYGIAYHNSIWMSLFSGSYGTASPWNWEQLHSPQTGNNWGSQPILSHLKAISDFANLKDITSEPFESYSNQDQPSSQNLVSTWLISGGVFVNADILVRTYMECNSGKTRFFGWLQDWRFDQHNLIGLPVSSGSGSNFNLTSSSTSKYMYTLDPQFRPSPNLSTPGNSLFLTLSVAQNKNYEIKWYSIASTGIQLLSAQTSLASNGSVIFTIPELDGVFGDVSYTVSMIDTEEPVTGCNTITDLVRIGDPDGDGFDNLVLNNRCIDNRGAIRNVQLNNGSSISQQDHIGEKYAAIMDNNDKFFVRNVTNIHSGDEYIFFNRGLNPNRNHLMVVNPSNGSTLNQPMPFSYLLQFLGAADQTLMGDVDGDKKEELVLINYNAASGSQAVSVLDVIMGTRKFLYNYSSLFNGWLDQGDKSYLADIDGDGHQDLVLFNTQASASAGAVLVLDLTTGNIIHAWSHGSSGTAFQHFFDACDRIYIADVDKDGKDEIVLVNTSMLNGELAFKILSHNPSITLQTAPAIYHTGSNFSGWMDTDDKMIVGEFDNTDGQDLLLINTTFSPTAGAIRVVNFIRGTWPIQDNYAGINQYAGWFDVEDVQGSAWNPLGTSGSNYDCLLLVNRGANASNSEDIYKLIDFHNVNGSGAPVIFVPYTHPYDPAYQDYWFDGYVQLKCDGSVNDAGGGDEISSPAMPTSSGEPAIEEIPDVSLYPNPYPGMGAELVITVTKGKENQKYDVKILDATGRLVYSGNFKGTRVSINAQQLGITRGIYSVTIRSTDNRIVANKKWVVLK